MAVLAAYGFNEGTGTTAGDAVGTRDVTVVSPGNWNAAGHTGAAFDGAGGVRTVPSHAGLETASRTLMFWARAPGTVGNQWIVQFYVSAPDTAAWGIGWIGGNLFMRARIGGVNTNLTTPIVDETNWHHFALTYDGATLRGYQDAVEFSSTALTGAIDSADAVRLSDTPDSALIDDLRFYDEALDQATIESLMNTPVAGEGHVGDVNIDVDVDVIPVGAVAKSSDAQIDPSVAIVAAGTVALGGQAQITSTASLSATGAVGNFGQASISAVVTLSASGVSSGQVTEFCEPLTVVVTGPNLTVDVTGPELTVEVTPC